MSGNKVEPQQGTESECREVANFQDINQIRTKDALSGNKVKPQQSTESEDINKSFTEDALPGNKVETQKRTGYDSMKKTNLHDTALDSERTIQATCRVVVVGRAGCGKSTICNALLNAEKDKFHVDKGMGSSTGDFQSEINEENKLEVVDTPDVFSMGYNTDGEARNKFRKKSTWTLSEIPTAFLFPIRMNDRFTPIHYDLCNKYLQLLAKPYKKENTILLLIDGQPLDPEKSVKSMEQTSLPKFESMFGDRIIHFPQVPKKEDKKKLISEVIKHLSNMGPISLEPERNVLETILRVLNTRAAMVVLGVCALLLLSVAAMLYLELS